MLWKISLCEVGVARKRGTAQVPIKGCAVDTFKTDYLFGISTNADALFQTTRAPVLSRASFVTPKTLLNIYQWLLPNFVVFEAG